MSLINSFSPCLNCIGVDDGRETPGHGEDARDGQQDEDGHVDGGVALDLRRLRYEQCAGIQVGLDGCWVFSFEVLDLHRAQFVGSSVFCHLPRFL